MAVFITAQLRLGFFTLKLARLGTAITAWVAKDGAPLRQIGTTQNGLGSPVLVGLAVASHTQTAVNTILWTGVSVDQPAPAGAQR